MRFRVLGILLLLVSLGATAKAQNLSGAYLAANRAYLDGDFVAASEYYLRAIEADPQNPILRQNAIMTLIYGGDFESGRTVAQSFTAKENIFADLVLMADAAQKGDFETAYSLFPKTEPLLADLLSGLLEGWLELGRGNTEQAIAIFDSMDDNQSVAFYAQYHKVLALAYLGEFEAALTIMEGDDTPLHINRQSVLVHAEILSVLGRNTDALALLDSVRSMRTDGELFDNLRAQLKADQTVPFTQIATPDHGIAAALLAFAEALTREEPNRLGLFYARLAEQILPEFVEISMVLANILEREDQYGLAADMYAKVPQGSAYYIDATIGKAETERLSGSVETATATLSDLADRYPADIVVLNALGDIHRGEQNWVDAAAVYTRAIENIDVDIEGYWVIYYARGICYERTDQWAAAEADFRRALELSPDQPSVLNYLGYSFVEMGINLEEAQEMIETAVARDPNSGYIRDSLAWILYRLGKFEEAVPHMELAAQQLPVDPVINDHLGDVLWMVGRKTEAVFQWRRAISFDPEETDLIRIKRKLEVGLDLVLEEEAEN